MTVCVPKAMAHFIVTYFSALSSTVSAKNFIQFKSTGRPLKDTGVLGVVEWERFL